jgi:hypothetical protein
MINANVTSYSTVLHGLAGLAYLGAMAQSPTIDKAQLSYLVSEEIASCVLELIRLESRERDYVAMLERKAELESRIAWLQRVEAAEF